jgi:6-pyruvoyltetrahydropterin/6-carboxytetrahydropterin synthase
MIEQHESPARMLGFEPPARAIPVVVAQHARHRETRLVRTPAVDARQEYVVDVPALRAFRIGRIAVSKQIAAKDKQIGRFGSEQSVQLPVQLRLAVQIARIADSHAGSETDANVRLTRTHPILDARCELVEGARGAYKRGNHSAERLRVFEASVDDRFCAAHQLRRPDGSMEPLHGHNWRVVVTFRAAELDALGVVVDFVALRRELEQVLAALHNRNLNELPAFAVRNPSAENVALHIAESLSRTSVWRGSAVLRCVDVEEAPGCIARYCPPVVDFARPAAGPAPHGER